MFGGAERAVASVTRPVGRFFGAGVAGTGGAGQTAAMQRQLVTMRAELSAARLSQGRVPASLAGCSSYRAAAATG